MKFKAVITDLDGTALDSPSEKRVSKRLVSAIAALDTKGIKVCAATGRSQTFAQPVIDSMGLLYPVIIAGGTKIINPVSGEEVWSCDLSRDQVTRVVEMLKDTTYSFLWNDYNEDDYLKGGWQIDRFTAYESTYFFEVCFVPQDEVKELVNHLVTIKDIAATVVNAQRPGMNDIHITHRAATKEHAIYELEKILGLTKSEMIGIGDAHNDLHLFKAVGHKVAMGNAVVELKEAADEAIGPVTEEGLAIYFEHLLEENENEI